MEQTGFELSLESVQCHLRKVKSKGNHISSGPVVAGNVSYRVCSQVKS